MSFCSCAALHLCDFDYLEAQLSVEPPHNMSLPGCGHLLILLNLVVLAPQTLHAFVPVTPQWSRKGSPRSFNRHQNELIATRWQMSASGAVSRADKLRDMLSKPEILIMPCCYDGLTARLVEDAGFPLTFMTGFGVSGAHGLPDTQVSPSRFFT